MHLISLNIFSCIVTYSTDVINQPPDMSTVLCSKSLMFATGIMLQFRNAAVFSYKDLCWNLPNQQGKQRSIGLYWINTTNGLHQVKWDMELECGGHKGGWCTIVKLDTSKGDSCSSGWTKYNITTPGDLPKVVCWSGNDASGCYSAIFTTYNITFDQHNL